MHDIEKRIMLAKENSAELNQLLLDYLPFIKKQLTGLGQIGLEYDDMLSLSMLAFVNAVKQYSDGRGNFLSFSAVCIRNRIVDEGRKQWNYSSKIIPLYPQEENAVEKLSDEQVSLSEYNKNLEREGLCYEIENFSGDLQKFGISFSELAKICPKRNTARQQCIAIANAVLKNSEMKHSVIVNHKLPQSELAEQFSISGKTLEKHRKYIVALVLLFMGDYPGIKAFLPQLGVNK